eukprot:1157568-Pelagomonas_calceolata.AAC.2
MTGPLEGGEQGLAFLGQRCAHPSKYFWGTTGPLEGGKQGLAFLGQRCAHLPEYLWALTLA